MTGRAGATGAAAERGPALLFVCTANLVRSPVAAALAERALAGTDIEIGSAGFLPGGHPLPPGTLRAATSLGLSLRGQQSRQLSAGILERSDVVITMTREQARELVADDPALWPRVFTLKQFARWAVMHRAPARGLTREWLSAEGAKRRPMELLGADPFDDVADPMGQPPRVWNAVAEELAAAVDEIARALRPRLARAPGLSPTSTP